MKRVNTFRVVPQSDADEELLRRLLDASASLWNELNYERRQIYFDDDDSSVWDTDEYRGRYNGIVGSATVQQLTRKNSEAWRSVFFSERKRRTREPTGLLGQQRGWANAPYLHLLQSVHNRMGQA